MYGVGSECKLRSWSILERNRGVFRKWESCQQTGEWKWRLVEKVGGNGGGPGSGSDRAERLGGESSLRRGWRDAQRKLGPERPGGVSSSKWQASEWPCRPQDSQVPAVVGSLPRPRKLRPETAKPKQSGVNLHLSLNPSQDNELCPYRSVCN
jgi:hypothetical protein